MLKKLDAWIDSNTMYHLMLNCLKGLVAVTFLFSIFHLLHYSVWSLVLSFFILTMTCYTSNVLFAKVFKAQISVESSSITAFILFLIMLPPTSVKTALLLAATGLIAMASKYILAWKKKHIFNPAAIAAVIIVLVSGYGAIWFVGSKVMLPFLIIVGYLIIKKIRRFPLFLAFCLTSLTTIAIVTFTSPFAPGMSMNALIANLWTSLASWPIIFFGSVMLTEPSTTPPTKNLQIIYGIIVGLLFGIPYHIGQVYGSPEMALVIGNVFSYAVSSKKRLMLILKEKTEIAKDIWHFTFEPNERLAFAAGQYLEWTLPHEKPDNRGNRRYFTVASAPSEASIAIGVKIAPSNSPIAGGGSSSFKKALLGLNIGDKASVAQLSGDFTLPKDTAKKLVFVAGGIGVTPFRSMVKCLLDKREKRDIVLVRACAAEADFAYDDVFSAGERAMSLKNIRIVTDPSKASPTWSGYTGYLTAEILKKEVPDYADRTFYLSGPNVMVLAYKKLLKSLGVSRSNIKTDYFPGF